jgi:hypothetical protein
MTPHPTLPGATHRWGSHLGGVTAGAYCPPVDSAAIRCLKPRFRSAAFQSTNRLHGSINACRRGLKAGGSLCARSPDSPPSLPAS